MCKLRRYIMALLCCVTLQASPWTSQAQTLAPINMTDQKILEYITQASEEGKSQQEIAMQLMKWGVTNEQLQRVKRKYQKGDQDLGSQKQMATSLQASNAALRESNGEMTQVSEDATETIEAVLNIDEMESSANQDAQNRIFGHDIFRSQKLTFEPNMNITAPQDYVLGPGDEVVIDIFGATQVSIHQFLNAEGVIVIDQYGPLSVGGFTLAQADRLIRQEVGAMYESSTVRVSVGQTRTILINVMGEVNVPGTYHLSAFSSVFHALYAASGVTDNGTLRNIKVYRNGREVTTVDVYEYLVYGKMSTDIHLQDNDLIIVEPYEAMVIAEGSIKRPMRYEMKRGETVNRLLKYVGGFAANAYTDAVRITRSNGKRSTAYNVKASEGGAFILQDGDRLTVDKHEERFENIVEARGAVFRPGIFHIGGDVNTIRQLIEAADGMTETALSHHALMYRMNEDRTHTLIAVDINGILNGTLPDMALQSEDILYIPSNEEALKARTIEIQGEVFNPGTYEYADNETLEDLILQAGGLLETASSMRVDVARQLKDPKATNEREDDVRAEFFHFELQDGLIINQNPSFKLKPYDQVFVRRCPSYYAPQNVEIEGQILYPGVYALTKQNERISDLVEKAGGIKRFAYIKGASLQRRLSSHEQYITQQMIDQARIQKDTALVNTLTLRLNGDYSVGIDLEKALANPGSHDDLVLRSGDVLVIPDLDNTVKVSGEVFYPNTITYTDNTSPKYYIAQAGGFSDDASKRNGYIIYKNGRVARIKKGAKVEPGCEIVIPKRVRHDYSSKATTYIAMASSLATIAALIFNIVK